MTVRVRIAPAPSGSLHIGNVRTALYNWLFARHHKGTFILRIEDTDQERVREEFIRSAMDELRWLGLGWDEGPEVEGPHGPYRQSQRLDTYREAAERLADEGLAYRCYCTPEELDARRKGAITEGRRPSYDGRCYRLTGAEKSDFESEGRRWVLRFHVSEGPPVAFDDLVTGPVEFERSELEDFAIFRQNGFPIYNFGVAIDDALMRVTHVIRGMDIQSSTPRQILVMQALGHDVPRYGHIPLVMGEGGKKLSKRTGADSVQWFRESGYLPEATINYLALLGTGFGDETIVSLDEMVAQFDIANVNASPAAVDMNKILWMNGEYIRMTSDEDLTQRIVPWLVGAGVAPTPPSGADFELIRQITPLIKSRIKLLAESVDYARPFFGRVPIEEGARDKVLAQPHVGELFDRAGATLGALAKWNRESIEAALREVQVAMELKPRTAFVPFYVAICGSSVGAPIFDAMAILGRDETLARLASARELIT